MAIKRPPQHRADAIPIYVTPDDDAWDTDALEAEKAEVERINAERMAAAGPDDEPELIDWEQHPVVTYNRGETRYDLDAPTFWRGKQRAAREWLGPDATLFVLRRLGWREYYEVRSALTQSSGFERPWLLACQLALVRIDGSYPATLRLDPDASKRSDAEMSAIFDLNPQIPLEIGAAAWLASQPLTDAEKKA